MLSLITDEIRSKATELYRGDDICQVKSRFLLSEMGLPTGLLPLPDMEECGYIKDTGFVWLRQKNKCRHKFQKIGRLVHYAHEITAYVEPGRIRKLTGVTTKELLVMVNISEIFLADPAASGNIIFRTPTGLFRTFPVAAFEEAAAAAVAVEKPEEEAKKPDVVEV